jgi:hypothetical protein
MFVMEALGAASGLKAGAFPHWSCDLSFGAALAVFPGFLVGLWVQLLLDPDRLREHRVMVRRIGLLALLFFVAALCLPHLDVETPDICL